MSLILTDKYAMIVDKLRYVNIVASEAYLLSLHSVLYVH